MKTVYFKPKSVRDVSDVPDGTWVPYIIAFDIEFHKQFELNVLVDNNIVYLKPIAESYRKLPDPIQSGTSNAVKNLSNLITIPNNVLQGDVKTAIINTGRFVLNTTVGLLGTIDVANKMGFPKYEKEDYGQTLGAWGFGPGCYLYYLF